MPQGIATMPEFLNELRLAVQMKNFDADARTALTVHELTMRRSRRHLMELITSIGNGRYFEAWLAATLLRAALVAAEQSVSSQSPVFRTYAERRVMALKTLAAPMLDLAPAPDCIEVRQLSSSWARAEAAWRHSVLHQCLYYRPHDPDLEGAAQMSTAKRALLCETKPVDWRRKLMCRIRAKGFGSATEYVDHCPLAPLHSLAEDLDLPPAAAYGLEQLIIEEAEQSDKMDHCARGLLARNLRIEMPDGWRAPNDDDPRPRQQRARAFESLAFALPPEYGPAIRRVRDAMEGVDIAVGWVPLGPEDPVLMELFGSYWNPFR
jgi:hypothetical protein